MAPAAHLLSLALFGLASPALARPRPTFQHLVTRNATVMAGTFNTTSIGAVTLDTAAVVCSLHCDPLDPSQAVSESFPVSDRIINGRVVRLHISDSDAMGWASIDEGVVGDGVWIDRSWDGGATWDGLLGKASIPNPWTGTRTLMYNLADPVNHRRGMLRACGDANGVQCTDWVHLQVCDIDVCDGLAYGTVIGGYTPVPAASVAGSTITLHMDSRNTAWAAISGSTGDEVWLDRSWDEGATWASGSLLERTNIPTGSSSTSTAMIATRETKSLLYGGVVRACGRASSGNNVACTSWARPAYNRAWTAANTLMWSYDVDTAWWLSSWWNTAVAVTTLMDYMIRTGDHQYLWVVERTFNVNKGAFPAGVKSGDKVEGDFISRAIDDMLWWGVAWSTAYDLTRDQKYLNEAIIIANYASKFYDTSSCGGGIWWSEERTYKNAVTIGLYIKLNGHMHNQMNGDKLYIDRAVTAWNWFVKSGLVNSASLVNDGLNNCANNGGTVWSYNQGLAIGGAVEIYRISKDPAVLAFAEKLASAAIANSTLTRAGILTESCDVSSQCDDNQKQFKGIFMRYIMELADVSLNTTFRTYAQKQADSIWSQDRDALARFGERWGGADSTASPNVRDWRTQASALGGLLAALPPPS